MAQRNENARVFLTATTGARLAPMSAGGAACC